MFVINTDTIQIFHTECVGTFIIYHHIHIHTQSSDRAVSSSLSYSEVPELRRRLGDRYSDSEFS